MTGKEKCEILRTIRRQIAQANNIPYPSEEEDICPYEGDDCTGTCPQCECEVMYLEAGLTRKRKEGERVTLEGIGVDAIAFRSSPEPMGKGETEEFCEDDEADEEQRTLERMKNRLWIELADQDFPAELLVRLQGKGILTVGDLMARGAYDLHEKDNMSLRDLKAINDMLEKHGLPELRGMSLVERRHIRGMMRRNNRW